MRRFIDPILKPNKITLLLYGVLSFIWLTVYVWICSFIWAFIFSVTDYIVGLFATMIIGLVILRLLDKKFNWQLKRYFVVSIIQLLFIWVIFNPIRTWQIESSLEKAKLIIEPLKTYKERFNTYPSSLEELRKTLDQEIPTRTNIGTQYWYEIDNDQDYRLWFVSYYGHTAYFNNKQDNWIITD